MSSFPHYRHCLAAHWVKCSKFCTARQNLPAERQRPCARIRFVSRILTSLCTEINKIPCPKCWHSGLPLSEGIKEVMAQWWFLTRLILIWFDVTQTHVHMMLLKRCRCFIHSITEFPPGIWFILGCCPGMTGSYPFLLYFSPGIYGKIYRDSVSVHFLL